MYIPVRLNPSQLSVRTETQRVALLHKPLKVPPSGAVFEVSLKSADYCKYVLVELPSHH